MSTKKVNFLNNKDMLLEIHQSKKSYCEFDNDKYSDYDFVVELESLINGLTEEGRVYEADKIATAALKYNKIRYPNSKKTIEDFRVDPDTLKIHETMIEVAINNRADRLSKELYRTHILENPNSDKKLSSFKVDPSDIKKSDLVFRFMTYDHIPKDEDRKKNPTNTQDHHVKLNFPPFKHFVLTNDDSVNDSEIVKIGNLSFSEVGRSHYKDSEFCDSHGGITNTLAKMFMLLVNRYSQKANWRGYCVDESTDALTKRGWLGINDIRETDEILSYNDGRLVWSPIRSIFRSEFSGKMHKISNKYVDMLVTPGHKLVTGDGLVPVEMIRRKDTIVLSGSPVDGASKMHTDSFVELAAWIITEGCYEYRRGGLHSISISQNEGMHADRIRNCLKNLGYEFSESKKRNKNNINIRFLIRKKDSIKIHEVLPIKALTMDFILSLNNSQRSLFIKTLMDGDRWLRGNNLSYCQKDKDHVDAFQALCIMEGIRTKSNTCHNVDIYSERKNVTNGDCLNFHGGFNSGRSRPGLGKVAHQNFPTEEYKGRVWCPETLYGSFISRRNGIVHLTGNTYIDEMKGRALLQLSEMGLKFDESKSDNPFAYYTTLINNSFRRIATAEKKSQSFRDDLLIEAGHNPSYTRQFEIEEEIRRMRESAENDD